jgi:hypothetical protein
MNIIAVTVGLSILDKCWAPGSDISNALLDREGKNGLLDRSDPDAVLAGNAWRRAKRGIPDQAGLEQQAFDITSRFSSPAHELTRGRNNHYSGEVSSLYAIFNDAYRPIPPRDCRIALLASDSADGVFAARINKRVIAHRLLDCPLEKARQWQSATDDGLAPQLEQVRIHRIPDLQVRDPLRFENGLEHLQNKLREIHRSWSRSPGQRVMNITGGYKGVIPVAAASAWSCGWEVAYLFEETERIVWPQTPPGMEDASPENLRIKLGGIKQ